MDEDVARAARSRGGVIVLRGAPRSLAALVDRRGDLRRTGPAERVLREAGLVAAEISAAAVAPAAGIASVAP